MKYKQGIALSKETLYKREYEKDVFRNCKPDGAWTVALCELEGHDYKYLEYETEKQIYTCTLKDALRYGYWGTLAGIKKLIIPMKVWAKSSNVNPTINFPVDSAQMSLV